MGGRTLDGSGANQSFITGANYPVGLAADGGKNSTATSVSCSATPVVVGQSTTCTATVSDTASSGQTTPAGTVRLASDTAGSFAGNPCTLSGSGASASCQVTYTPSVAGSGTHALIATYGGDGAHSGGSGQTTVTVKSRSTSASVSCSPTTVPVGQSTTCTATVTDTDTDTDTDVGSSSTSMAMVSSASDSAGSFTGGPRTLSGSSASASCQVTYTPSALAPDHRKLRRR